MKISQPKDLSTLKRIALFIVCAALPAVSLHGQSDPSLSEILTSLAEPVTVNLDGGNHQTGRITLWDESSLRIEVSLGGGTAEMTFPASDIQGIQFPGLEHKQLLYQWKSNPSRAEDALNLYRAYYQQQGAYLSLLNQRQLGLFIDYAEFALEQNEPIKAVAMIDVISPYIEDEAVLKQLEESLLLGFFQAGMREEAEVEARKWIKEAEPAGTSALGWRLLAELSFEQEAYENAYWTAMHPVAFSNQMPMTHLDVCYALAILAAEELRFKKEPRLLAAEMKKRGFEWPEQVGLLTGKAPEYFTTEMTETDANNTSDEPAEQPITLEEAPRQTPSPVDPVESLPTRIYN